MKRHGAVVVFKEGVTPREAANALAKIADVLDLPENSIKMVPCGTTQVSVRGRTVKKDVVNMVREPFEMIDKINEFDDDWGGPVWYIP